jgi:hypothetical protein
MPVTISGDSMSPAVSVGVGRLESSVASRFTRSLVASMLA